MCTDQPKKEQISTDEIKSSSATSTARINSPSTATKGALNEKVMFLEKELVEAGEKLLDPQPNSSLLKLLDSVYLYLSVADQEPSGSIEDALSPLKKALVSETLFKHSDVDVKVAVTSCIIEVMRITAPDAPYDDEKMREVLQSIVSSFEHLADRSSRSYTKRTSILNTLARARASVLMLDLGCDALLIEMFQHFLKSLRDHHVRVSVDMVNIMSLVLEESDDIPPQLLSSILHYVKKDAEVPQVSRRLAEQVLINCASKLKTCLSEAVKTSGVSLDKYSSVVASICEDTQNAVEVSTPEKTRVPKRRSKLEHSPRDETVAEVVVKTEEVDPAETESQTHKRARVESSSRHSEMEKAAAEGEPSCPTQQSSSEPGDLQRKKAPQPCSVTHQLAKVRQSIVDTITSVRQFRSELDAKEQIIVDTLTSVQQFRSEIKNKEDNLEASLQEVDVLGEKILGINKILNA